MVGFFNPVVLATDLFTSCAYLFFSELDVDLLGTALVVAEAGGLNPVLVVVSGLLVVAGLAVAAPDLSLSLDVPEVDILEAPKVLF